MTPDANWYRAKFKQLKFLAEDIKSPEIRRALLSVSVSYEHLANSMERIERHVVRTPDLKASNTRPRPSAAV